MVTALTVEHPAWDTGADGACARLMNSETGRWLATWTTADGLSLACVAGDEDTKPKVPEVTADELPDATPPQLLQALAALGTVQRVANPWLWDALSTAILRQVVRAGQARILYRRWCSTYGESLSTPAGPLNTVPSPETVLALPDEAFKSVGAAFHRTALQAAATAYLQHGDTTWNDLPAGELVQALDEVPRIGPWTAAAAACDFTGDFSIYPHGDLAVRTWAAKAAPGVEWPDTDKAFAAAWKNSATSTRQLHALTLLTLSWGSHVLTQHGGTQRRH